MISKKFSEKAMEGLYFINNIEENIGGNFNSKVENVSYDISYDLSTLEETNILKSNQDKSDLTNIEENKSFINTPLFNFIVLSTGMLLIFFFFGPQKVMAVTIAQNNDDKSGRSWRQWVSDMFSGIKNKKDDVSTYVKNNKLISGLVTSAALIGLLALYYVLNSESPLMPDFPKRPSVPGSKIEEEPPFFGLLDKHPELLDPTQHPKSFNQALNNRIYEEQRKFFEGEQ